MIHSGDAVAIREGKWRCRYCSVVNRGADLACTGCGATRDKDVQFFLEDEAPEVEDEALLDKARAGADWLCLFCQTSNRPAASHCVQCGAERGTSPSRPVLELRDQPPPPAPPAKPAARGTGCGLLVALGLLLALGLCAVAGYFAFRKSEDTVTVVGFEWERTIDVQSFRTVRDSAWEGEAPSGARVVSRSREVHHTDRVQAGTKRVKVGKKDLGNGFFEDVYEDQPVYKEQPVYRQKIAYDVERWVDDRTGRAGGKDQTPRWPDPGLRSREREGARHERYVVLLRGKKDYRMELPLARWAALHPGETLHAVIRGGSTVLEIR